ncbi:MAG: Sec-independent protein translocase subunit TatA/TatB [Terriglobales bacterium]
MSFGELLFLLVLAVLVFGPRKLPEIARAAAQILAGLRRVQSEIRDSLEEEVRHIEVSEHPAPRLEAAPGVVARAESAAAQEVAPPRA